MLLRTTTTAFVALTILLALLGATAQAGRYHVYSCRMPDGEAAPVDGWSGSVAKGGAYDDYALDTCESGGALIAALGDKTTHLAYIDQSTWALGVPGFASLAQGVLWRASYLHGSSGERATYQDWIASPTTTSVIDECIYGVGCHSQGELTQPLSTSNRVAVPTASAGAHMYVNMSCGGMEGSECEAATGDPNGYAAVIYLYAADLTLEQIEGPAATSVTGELTTTPTVSGTSDIAFQASDPGAGVYEAVFTVDGAVVQRTVLDTAGGRCRDVGQTSDGLPAFLYLQPCPASVSADVGFDSTAVSDGTHHLVVSVIDAAGNSAPVLDRNITISNHPQTAIFQPAASSSALGAPNGIGASSNATLVAAWKGTRGTRLASPFGRSHTIIGTLTGLGGSPISGARIEVARTPAYSGARSATAPLATTDSRGRFSIGLASSSPSQLVRLSYRAHVGDPLPAAMATLSLTVKAAVSLNVAPRVSSVGKTITFRGRLLGGPIPRGGMPLVLEARSGHGAWLQFHVARSDLRGRFHASYRFRFPGPVRYQFRVLCEAEADYPFAAAGSKVVSVLER